MIEDLQPQFVYDLLKGHLMTSCEERNVFENELQKLLTGKVKDVTLKRKLCLASNPIIQTSLEMAEFINSNPNNYQGLLKHLKELIEVNVVEMQRPTSITYTNVSKGGESVPQTKSEKVETSSNAKVSNHLGFPTVEREVVEEKEEESSKSPNIAEITIIITSLCSLANESIQFLSNMEKDKLLLLFQEVIKHQKGLFNKQYLKRLFGKIIVVDKNERQFYPKPLEQEIVPNQFYLVSTYVSVESKGETTMEELKSVELNREITVKEVQFKADFKLVAEIDIKGKSEIFNFCNYFRYLDNKLKGVTKLQYILPEFIDWGIKEVQKEMFGMDHHVGLMKTEVRMLSSLNIPRGFLFWGPPGTGKTTVAKKLCDYWTIKQVCESLASGDFKQGYQGDSEKMIRHLGERAGAIPWILSAVVIDEIDALAQSREGGHGEKGDVNMISILLSMIGGMNDVPNLIFFGSTNLYQTMDEAFLRRMDGKFFIGKPSFEARENWIRSFTDTTPPKILFEKSTSHQTVEQMQILTINFSHDAMLKLLTKMQVNYQHDYKDLVDGIAVENIVGYIAHICKMNKIYFGRYILTELLAGLKKLTTKTENGLKKATNERYSTLNEFWDYSTGQREAGSAYTGKILVDLTDSTKSFGLEYGFFLKEEQMGVEEVLESISHSPEDLKTLYDLGVIQKSDANILLYQDTKQVMNLKLNSSILKYTKPRQIIEKVLTIKRDIFRRYLLENCEDITASPEDIIKNLRQCTEEFIKEFKNQLSDKRPLKQTKVQYLSLNYKSDEDRVKNDLSLEEALTILLKFGVVGNFDAVYYIDANTLYANNLLSEDRILQYIESLNSECNEYNRSMIIFDLDSIAELRRNYSGFKDQDDALEVYETDENKKSSSDSSFHSPTFNYSMMRSQVITRIIRLLIDTKYTANGPKIWYTAISSDKYIVNMIKREVKWPEDEVELEKKQKLEELKRVKFCKNCSQEFTEEENSDESCCYHSLNKLYFEHDRRFMEEFDQKQKKEALAKKSNDLERKKYLKENRNSIFTLIEIYTKEQIEQMIKDRMSDINVNEVRWVCCGRSFHEEGENVCSHEEYELPVTQGKNQTTPTNTTTSTNFSNFSSTSSVKPSTTTNSTPGSSLFYNFTNTTSNNNNPLLSGQGNSNPQQPSKNQQPPSLFSTQNQQPSTVFQKPTSPIAVTGMDNLCLTCKIGTRHREHGVLLPYCSNFCASRDLCINCKLKPKYFDVSTGTLHQFCGNHCEQRYQINSKYKI